MAEAVYILGTLVTLSCAVLLLRGYARVRLRLLLWSGLCFVGLTVANFLVFLDFVVVQNVSLHLARLFSASVAMALLLYGLIWEGE